ncbi:peptidoglycan-binding domain-containing protein [Serinibacter salmoneus]|uniref:Putative peptidoglycan binding protein n=1 Tax=Serinibacter salmoneus TaxID=556530 RepID=A0A2A9D233_9MICO|nr:peptidoglycan-binding domain-containing protein [Serinibacter salmoneus]PFG20757.1 putative peptidoglycan binding protein [Serinibacter salmoneus]
MTTTVTRTPSPLAQNALVGVVTALGADGEHSAGSVLYRVGETPVVLIAGETPFWRDLGQGSRGQDVRAVQEFLGAVGFDIAADGVWGAGTTEAVKDWQEQIAAPATGSLPLGTLVTVPQVPAQIIIDREKIWPGATLSGGEVVLLTASGEPTFEMEVTTSQAELAPVGTSVHLEAGDVTWQAVIAEALPNDSGGVSLRLASPEGATVCGQECDALPAGIENYLLTQVEVVAPQRGPVVPVSALRTSMGGDTNVTVVTAEGEQERRVEVLAIADGLAVVSGLSAGEQIRVFADEAPGEITPDPGDTDPTPTSEKGPPSPTSDTAQGGESSTAP